MSEKVINITPNASAQGLRERLERESASRGKPVRSFVGSIYRYAISNRARFTGPLKNAGSKPGRHIGATVPDNVAKALEKWAHQEETSRGMWCCFILEKALEDGLLDKVFGGSRGD
jgi:hypothetical protein